MVDVDGSPIHVVSMSGGKDSTAVALFALEEAPRDSLRFVFADTGNEHASTYEYLSYLEAALGITIVRLRRDFSEEWEHRRQWLMSDAPRKWNGRWPARSEEVWDRIGEDWTPVGEVTAPWRGRRKSVPHYLMEFMDRGLVERRGKHSKTAYRRTVP